MKWRKSEIGNLPSPRGENVLVYDPNTGFCKFSIKYYEPPKANYCWGWYPGGRPIDGTYWLPLNEVPLPAEGDVIEEAK